MPERLLFSKDAGESCNETMILCAGCTIASFFMYRKLHPNFDLTERNCIGGLGRRNVGETESLVTLSCGQLSFELKTVDTVSH